jgi:precorrin-6Y C5,15-methyltransferase (decarboxylating)
MTKSEIRAVVMSKLALPPDSICADIGAGTGSVSVEMALAAYNGKVFAVEREQAAAELIRQNCRKFQVGNVAVIEGEAPAMLETLPPLDAAFIGGSGGHLADIMKAVWVKNQKAKIVITSITMKTLNTAVTLWKENGAEPDIVLQSVSRIKSGMFIANNPIFIISGGGG